MKKIESVQYEAVLAILQLVIAPVDSNFTRNLVLNFCHSVGNLIALFKLLKILNNLTKFRLGQSATALVVLMAFLCQRLGEQVGFPT